MIWQTDRQPFGLYLEKFIENGIQNPITHNSPFLQFTPAHVEA